MAKTVTLDAKIAAALSANGSADRTALVALCDEAAAAIAELQATIQSEEARILDLDNPDPDKSIALIASSRLRIERYAKAIGELRPRVDAIDLEARQEAWTEEADKLRDEADALYSELEETYPVVVTQLMELFIKGRRNAAAFAAHARKAPPGVDKGFSPAIPRDGFWLGVQLPDWNDPSIVYPPHTTRPNPMQELALQSAAFAKALDAKSALLSGPDWAAAKTLQDEQTRAEIARREAELKAEAEASRQAYERSLQEQDRRRRGIVE